jgi:hypothetical protein
MAGDFLDVQPFVATPQVFFPDAQPFVATPQAFS